MSKRCIQKITSKANEQKKKVKKSLVVEIVSKLFQLYSFFFPVNNGF